MTTPRDQAIDLLAQLTIADALAVLQFAKMRLFAQDLSPEMTPSIDEWEKTPQVVRDLCEMAIDQSGKLIRYVSN